MCYFQICVTVKKIVVVCFCVFFPKKMCFCKHENEFHTGSKYEVVVCTSSVCSSCAKFLFDVFVVAQVGASARHLHRPLVASVWHFHRPLLPSEEYQSEIDLL